jgi:hypothetical protein
MPWQHLACAEVRQANKQTRNVLAQRARHRCLTVLHANLRDALSWHDRHPPHWYTQTLPPWLQPAKPAWQNDRRRNRHPTPIGLYVVRVSNPWPAETFLSRRGSGIAIKLVLAEMVPLHAKVIGMVVRLGHEAGNPPQHEIAILAVLRNLPVILYFPAGLNRCFPGASADAF